MIKNRKNYLDIDYQDDELKKKALTGATFTITTQAIAFFLNFGGTVIMARMLNPDDFGLIAMVLTFSMLFQNFGFNGFTEAIIQKDKLEQNQISNLFWLSLLLSSILTIIFIALAPVISIFYGDVRLKNVAIILSITILLSASSTHHLALLKRRLDFFYISINELVAIFLGVAIPIILALYGWGYWALTAKWILIPLSTAVGAWILCPWRPSSPENFKNTKPMIVFALNTYGNFLMNYVKRNLDKLIIGKAFGSEMLGLYDRSYHLSNLLPNQILSPLHNVAISSFSRLKNEPINFQKRYIKVLSMVAFLGMPISASMTILSKEIVLFLFGEKWIEASSLLMAFSPSIGIAMLYMTHGWLHLSLGTPDKWFKWGIFEACVTTIMLVTSIPFGAIGLASAYTLSFYILLAPGLIYAGKPIELKFSAILEVSWKYFISSLIAGGFTWFIFTWQSVVIENVMQYWIIFQILIKSFFFLVVYFLLVITMYGSVEPIKDFYSVAKEMIPKR